MKILVVLAVLLTLLPVYPVHAEEERMDVITPYAPVDIGDLLRLGVTAAAFENTSRNDAAAALKAWASAIIREKNLGNIPATVSLYESIQGMTQDLHDGGLEIAAMSTEEFGRCGAAPDAVLLPATAQGVTFSYVLLTHRESGLKSAAQLDPSSLLLFNGPRMLLALPWIRSITGSTPRIPDNNWFGEQGSGGTSKAILQVYFRKAQAAVVTREAFDLACELNPQLRRDLTVLSESQPFVATVMFFRPSWSGHFRATIEEALLDLHQTTGGRQVLTIYQSTRLERHAPTVLQPTLDFLRRYGRK